eukprot:CAMPEP_0172595516 /NCGR_PEP_ID=MMETSP1068-20121228/15107_1 /TAXON_ID=35684 /ORGANISM="Pseudopedinella elastica, Strain CCMP716" /LENGTH=210 /DNA_ID=CAMNT_0013394087 /DNA_START=265 /DNA_END=894 /DNA_ORIENTATION=-
MWGLMGGSDEYAAKINQDSGKVSREGEVVTVHSSPASNIPRHPPINQPEPSNADNWAPPAPQPPYLGGQFTQQNQQNQQQQQQQQQQQRQQQQQHGPLAKAYGSPPPPKPTKGSSPQVLGRRNSPPGRFPGVLPGGQGFPGGQAGYPSAAQGGADTALNLASAEEGARAAREAEELQRKVDEMRSRLARQAEAALNRAAPSGPSGPSGPS